MRVLHVLDHSVPIGSGYSYRGQSIVCGQRRLGIEAVVLTSPKHGSLRDGREVIDGTTYYRTARMGGGLPFARELRLMGRLAGRMMRVALQERVGLIHAHSPSLNGVPALLVGRRLGVPVVYEVRSFWEDAAVSHGTFGEGSARYRLSRAIETAVMRGADRVVCLCEGIRREVAGRGVPEGRLASVPNGVDAGWLTPRGRDRTLAEKLGLGEGPVFGYVGSFAHYEGLPFLIRAAPRFLDRIRGARLLVVGGGRDEAAIREAVRGAGGRVTFLGRIPHEQVPDLYTLLDVLVLPRRRIRLTELVTPLKPLEAMAMAKPVLASDVGGHAELLRDGETGLLFPAEQEDALVDRAMRLGEDAGLRRRLGANGRAHVSAERTWERLIERYIPLYAGAA